MAEKIAIDFDGLFTNIFKLGGGIVLSEPTVAAVGLSDADDVKAVGIEAKKLIGKTAEDTKIVFPIFEGEIVNEKVAEKLLKVFLQKIGVAGKFTGVEAIISVACGTTAEMLFKYEKVAKNAGISKVWFIEAPLLSALGQRLPLSDSAPCFVIDMAGGTTNIAALSLDGVIAGISVNFGANKISIDIIDYVAEAYGLQIGLLTAERLKKEIGSLAEDDGLSTVINGRDIKTGKPRSVSIRAMDIIEPVKAYYDKVAELANSVLVKLPPEVSAEIRHAGVYVSGVSSDVYDLEKYYRKKLGMKVSIAENGMMSVALGGGITVANPTLVKKLALKR
jgi:rod shape-determining protein MreB